MHPRQRKSLKRFNGFFASIHTGLKPGVNERSSQALKLIKLARAVTNALLMHAHSIQQRQVQVSNGSSGRICEVSTWFQAAASATSE